MNRRTMIAAAVVEAALLILLPTPAFAQLGERPGHSLDNPIDVPHDLSGLSIKNPRVRVVHTTGPGKAGGSMYLQQVDPWLGYQRGRNLTQREFRARDGVFGDSGKLDGMLLSDGATHMMSRSHVSSCAVCHNTPYRDGGAGATIAKNGGTGRNTPHMFGAGLVEMIGLQIRLQALAIADDDRNGWISVEEARGKRCVLENLPAEVEGRRQSTDYGSFEDQDGDGRPDLNGLFHPLYVDKNGKWISFARDLGFPGVAGYSLEVQVFGFGHAQIAHRPPIATTVRAFAAQAFDIHSGLQGYDPTVLDDLDGDGFSRVSNAGALQCLTAAGRDRGAVLDGSGVSLDDPDRDGFCHELSEGDLDLVEWYLLNHPAPGRGRIIGGAKRGEALFAQVGCTSCHVPDWHLYAADDRADDYTQRYDGDRRFFDLIVSHITKTNRLEGRLVSLAERADGRFVPRRRAYTVRGVYSDFRYHDLGDAFHELQFDGTVVSKFRTTPLWGAGSTGPWGHDGASLSLDDVIRRHGCEAGASRKAYEALGGPDRAAVVSFLRSLVLYQTDSIPCDIDGDGQISERFTVAGRDTDYERLNPEWLFRVPGQIEGPTKNLRGRPIVSRALLNVPEAYGLELPYLKDTDEDGFPDVSDPAPRRCGYRNGRE